MEFLEFHDRIMKIIKKKIIPCQKQNSTPEHETNENLSIQRQKHENHEIHKIPRQNHNNYENLIIPYKKYEIPRIPYQIHENNENLIITC